MNTIDFIWLGIPLGKPPPGNGFRFPVHPQKGDKIKLEEELKAVMASPAHSAEGSVPQELAKAILNAPAPPRLHTTQITSFS